MDEMSDTVKSSSDDPRAEASTEPATTGNTTTADPPEGQGPSAAQPDPKPRRRVGMPRPTARRWGMNPEDRLRVMETCMVLPGAGWAMHFSIMMTMSLAVAIMGLSSNSPALVIGAMLIAPLMTPVLGIAASIAMALGDAAGRSVATVAAATFGAIAVSFVVAGWLPGELLTDEVLARTAPDARDLVVALAAGVAGSYATARPDVSSSLPGVAIAVALVPPLAVVGITMRAGEGELAWGALLLYATNLAAIVTVSTIVFVAAGFVPGRRLLSMAPRVIAGGLAALVIVAILGVLLGTRSYDSAQRATQLTEIRAATATWLEGTFNESTVTVDGTTVHVTVTGPTQLPPSSELRAEVAEILGETPDLEVTWIQGQTTDAILAAEEERSRTAEEQARAAERAAVIDEVVEEWLAGQGDRAAYELTATDVSSESVTVSVRATIQPPSLGDLERRLQDRLDEPVLAGVNWDDASAGEAQRRIDDSLAAARSLVQAYATQRALAVDDVTFDGTTLVVDLRGESPPDDGAELEDALRATIGEQATIRVFFIERVPVIPAATPTPTPEPTATPVPAATPTATSEPTATAEPTPDG